MADFFVGQTNLRIELETNVTLTDGTLLIKYIKPDRKTAGSFGATINGSDASKMYYDAINATDLDQAGKWRFWAHVVFAGGTIGIGSAIEQIIKEQGQI